MKIDGLRWEVWRGEDLEDLDAVCRLPEDAAILCGECGSGAVKYQGRIVWDEGKEDFSGSENNGYTAGEIMVARVEQRTPFGHN